MSMGCCDCNGYHEFNLSWLIGEIKKALKEWKEVAGEFSNVEEEFTALKNYVEDYFKNLDLDKEVADKINQMLEDGELDTIISNALNAGLTRGAYINAENIGAGSYNQALVGLFTNDYLSNAFVYMSDGLTSDERENEQMGVRNQAGTYLLPGRSERNFTSTGNALSAIATLASYINRGISYGRDNSIFKVDGTTFSQMVCSDYLYCALMGMPYNNSKAKNNQFNLSGELKSQIPKKEVSTLGPTSKTSLITRELAMYAASAGQLYRVEDRSFKNAMIGDCFFVVEPESDGQNLYYLNITHCGLIVDIDSNNNILWVLECGYMNGLPIYCVSKTQGESSMEPVFNEWLMTPGRFALYNYYIGRFPWSSITPIKVHDITGEVKEQAVTSELAEVFFINKALKKGDVVVLKMSGNLTDMNPTASTDILTRINVNTYTTGEGTADRLRIARRYWTEDYAKVPNSLQMIGVVPEDCEGITVHMSCTNGATLSFDYQLECYRC